MHPFIPLMRLRNGKEMPAMGLGLYQVPPEAVQQLVADAVQMGYSLFDTARAYRNEAALGKATAAVGNVFIETKLGPKDQGQERARAAIEASLAALGRIDLHLIHWPGAAGLEPSDPMNAELRRQSWVLLEEYYDAGKIASIGVSNYTRVHLQEMLSYARHMPHVNQIEASPLYCDWETVRFCRGHGIAVQAYSPLGRGAALENAAVLALAVKKRCTPAQVCLRWALQHGFAAIPKTTSKERLQENRDAVSVELAPAEMAALDTLEAGAKCCWDPSRIQ